MVTATLCARAGKKVLLLERHSVPGGFTHTFTRKGIEWDVGVHYVGQMNQPSLLKKILDDVTEENTLQWDDMGEVYDRAIICGQPYDFRKNKAQLIHDWINLFPEERKAIQTYFKWIAQASGSGPYFFGEKTAPAWFSKTIGRWLRFRFEKFSQQTTLQVLKRLTRNERLISLMAAQCGNYGLLPEKSAFSIHATVVQHYLNGASYPTGGTQAIAKSILKAFYKYGGVLRLNADVDQILLEKNCAVGVVLKDATPYFAKSVVSNAGARNTFLRLLPKASAQQSWLKNVQETLATLRPSIGHFCLYVKLKGTAAELNLPKNNLWIYPKEVTQLSEQDLGEDPITSESLTYISFPSAKDSTWEQRHPRAAPKPVAS